MGRHPHQRLSRQEQQRLTRERLLAAAEEVFTERGFAAATLEEISDRAGYSRTAVYKHFDNKEQLFVAVADELAARSLSTLEATVEREQVDAARLTTLGADIAEQIAAMQRWIVASMEFMAHVRDQPALRAWTLTALEAYEERHARMLVGLCESLGIEPPMPPRQLALTLWSVANGLAIRALVDDGLDIARAFSDALNALLHGGAAEVPTDRPTRVKARAG